MKHVFKAVRGEPVVDVAREALGMSPVNRVCLGCGVENAPEDEECAGCDVFAAVASPNGFNVADTATWGLKSYKGA